MGFATSRLGYDQPAPKTSFSSRPAHASVPLTGIRRQSAAAEAATSENASLRALLEEHCPSLLSEFRPAWWLSKRVPRPVSLLASHRAHAKFFTADTYRRCTHLRVTFLRGTRLVRTIGDPLFFFCFFFSPTSGEAACVCLRGFLFELDGCFGPWTVGPCQVMRLDIGELRLIVVAIGASILRRPVKTSQTKRRSLWFCQALMVVRAYIYLAVVWPSRLKYTFRTAKLLHQVDSCSRDIAD